MTALNSADDFEDDGGSLRERRQAEHEAVIKTAKRKARRLRIGREMFTFYVIYAAIFMAHFFVPVTWPSVMEGWAWGIFICAMPIGIIGAVIASDPATIPRH